MEHMPAGMSEKIAEDALRSALGELCRGGSWEGVIRGMAWRVASIDARDTRSIEMLADAAEAILVSLIDEALWTVERIVVQSWHEFLELRPGDKTGALTAAVLDAGEESVQLVESANARVAEALLAGTRHAA
jgi:hypothetical protein